MKIKLILLLTIAILSLSLLACVPDGKEMPLEFTYDNFVKQKNISQNITGAQVGDLVKITLPSNPGTGFKWVLAGISDVAILSQEGQSQYVLPDNPAPGAGGQEIWTFKVLKRGTGNVSMAYSQPWDGGTKGEWTLGVEIKVR
jgi:inhibitor of cysteine peptidase